MHDVQLVDADKLWSLTGDKVSYSADGLTWQSVKPLEHIDFTLVSFNN